MNFKIIVVAVVIILIALLIKQIYDRGTRYGVKISKKNKRKK